MKNVRKNLETICEIFKLGKLTGWESTTNIIGGLNEVIFNTETYKNQKYYFNPENL